MKSYSSITSNGLFSQWKEERRLKCLFYCILKTVVEKMYYWRKSVLIQNKHWERYMSVGTLVNEMLLFRWPPRACWVLNVSTWRWYRKDTCWCVSLEHLGCFLKLFQGAALQPDSASVFCLGLSPVSQRETDGRQRADVYFGLGSVCSPNNNTCFDLLLFSPLSLRCPTGLPMPGGDWRTRWGSRTWAGRSGSSSTTSMSRATQRGWASAARTAAQTVRLDCTSKFHSTLT